MESLLFTKMPLLSSPEPRLHRRHRFQAAGAQLPATILPRFGSTGGNPLRATPPAPTRGFACLSAPVPFPSSGGVGGGGEHRSGGGGGGGWGPTGAGSEADTLAADAADLIVLTVEGMVCGGCVASVKRILESQPDVSSATVNLEMGTAAIWVVPEVRVAKNWQQELGEKLANHLTTCGFKSNIRGIQQD